MISQRHRRGPGGTVIGIGLLVLAAGGIYLVAFSGDDEERSEHAPDRAQAEPRGSRRSGAWSGASSESASGSAGWTSNADRAPRAGDRAGGAMDGTPGSRSSARPMMDAGGRAVPVPASRLPVSPPSAIARPTGPAPPEVRLRTSEALERITAQRITELTEHLEAARRDGNTRRVTHLEGMIADMRAQQPRLREHIEATRRELEAASPEPAAGDPASPEPANDPPASAPSGP